uniref:RNA-directed DNA polymerase, eukaryota, reverse transcriptase zinc-binding domain protein n=1 Tax=Tanacetum cinerariifolium TaxID=118510 RepID=A0A6L2J0I1_TANCI|nr:RNA-directed DNA polymerase, eukaryota, reverse transcriptase zinc-binding domain protein [Tanacetum cinerariifolium]
MHFQREQKPKTFTPNVSSSGNSIGTFASILKGGNPQQASSDHSKPALVLDDSYIIDSDFSMSLMGQVKEVTAILNLYVILSKEGFHSVKLTYLGGLWVLIQLDSLDSVASKWGEVVEWEDLEDNSLSCKQLCLKTNIDVIINEMFKIILKGKVYWIRAKKLDAWVPNFISDKIDDYSADDDSNDVDEGVKVGFWKKLRRLLTKKNDNVSHSKAASDLIYPLGFTPESGKNHTDEGVIPGLDKGNLTFDYAVSHSVGNSGELSEKRDLWEYISSLINIWDVKIVILGDFNEVRIEQEKFGSNFNIQGANSFNNFISLTSLLDLPLDGYSFTWAHKSITKMSKLNHFLISQGLLVLFPHLSGLCLDRHLLDHRPILMRGSSLDYGPTPFRIFRSWFKMDGFDKLVEETWHSIDITDPNGLICMKKKLQLLKNAIKIWSKENKRKLNEAKFTAHNKLIELDKAIDQGRGNGDILNQHTMLMKELNDINSINVSKLSQKAKVRWSIEGDENFKYFHGILNIKRTQLAIRGILVDKDWIYWYIVDNDVVTTVSQFFASGNFPPGCNSSFIALIPKIHDAKVVKDFCPINLIGSKYKIIAKILANRSSFVMSDLISDVQTAFVANCQILDGPFILNELISWCKLKKVKTMIFKVDFENAFDFVRWDYLDDVLKSFGFGYKWRSWNSGCLNSAKGSTLVNGSPTSKFKFHKGLKQGDPLSLFLFILVMKSLHLSFKRVLEAGLIKGVSINNSLTISHLFYADDAIFVGVKVGDVMSRLNSWNDVIDKISSRLSKWKLKTLFIRGRLTLHKSVLTDIPLYHMSLFKAPVTIIKCMESIRRDFLMESINMREKLLGLVRKKF